MTFVPNLHVIYASTGGHTEYVVQTLRQWCEKNFPGVAVTLQRAEEAQLEDFSKGDVLLLASSSWNTGGTEGELNPHMFALCNARAAGVDLQGKRVAVLGLGDHRYRYLCKAADHLLNFVAAHGGTLLQPELRIIDEPYGQEEKVEEWARTLLSQL